MKILFNCLTMNKGGAERVISILSNGLSKENDVSVLTLTNEEDEYKLQKTIKRIRIDKKSDTKFKKLKKLSLRRFFKLKKEILKEKPDAIISFLPEPSLRLMFISKFSKKIRKVPKIISIRNDPAREYKNPILKFVVKILYKNVDGMVYQTNDAKSFFKNIIKTKNQVIILNPIDDHILVKPKEDAEREDIIVAVGRLEEQKNHEMLINAFYKTTKKANHDYVLKIYGEGSRRNFLQNTIHELGLQNKVFLEGQINNIIEKVNEAKIFVLSSHYEGMPNALIEAMAMKMPCISTDCPCGGPKMLIKNMENGILVKNNNENDLAEKMLQLIEDNNLRKQLAEKAFLIREKNNTEKIIEQWKKLIFDIMDKK